MTSIATVRIAVTRTDNVYSRGRTLFAGDERVDDGTGNDQTDAVKFSAYSYRFVRFVIRNRFSENVAGVFVGTLL